MKTIRLSKRRRGRYLESNPHSEAAAPDGKQGRPPQGQEMEHQTMERLTQRSGRTATTLMTALVLAAGLASGLSGCRGHGEWTSEGVTQAQDRMSRLKSGTEWDTANQQFLTGDLKKALASVNRSIAQLDTVAKSHTLHGRILVEMSRLEEGMLSFGRALAIDPQFADAHYYKAILHERFREFPKALESYLSAFESEASGAQYLVAAAEMHIEMDDLDGAEQLLTGKMVQFKHNAGVHQTLGHIAMMRGEMKEAARLFQDARLLAPDDFGVLEDLALAQIRAEDFGEAEYALRRLLTNEVYANRRDLQHAQARCLVEIGRPVDARQILIDLTTDDAGKNDAQAWTDLGEVSALLGDMRRVRQAAVKLLAIAPRSADGHMLMAIYQMRERKDMKAALKSLDMAIPLASDDATPHILRGIVLTDLGREDEATKSFEQAIQIDPMNIGSQRMIAGVGEDDDS